MIPFTLHWKEGLLPPFNGVAVNVTMLPVQDGFEDAAMLTLTGRFWFCWTDIMISLDVAGLPVVQTAFEVRLQVIVSLFWGIYE
jgi:hypothetical protein